MKDPKANLTGFKTGRQATATPAAGAPGESAYQIAVRLGFNGTERQWLESLKGEPGPAGGGGGGGPSPPDGTDVGGGTVMNFAYAFNGGTPSTTGDFRAFGGIPSGY